MDRDPHDPDRWLDPWADPRATAPLPDNYGEIARKVDACMRIDARGCCAGPYPDDPDEERLRRPDACDLGAPCWRHAHTPEIAARYERMKRRVA
jgi:hypothetical protein